MITFAIGITLGLIIALLAYVKGAEHGERDCVHCQIRISKMKKEDKRNEMKRIIREVIEETQEPV